MMATKANFRNTQLKFGVTVAESATNQLLKLTCFNYQQKSHKTTGRNEFFHNV